MILIIFERGLRFSFFMTEQRDATVRKPFGLFCLVSPTIATYTGYSTYKLFYL